MLVCHDAFPHFHFVSFVCLLIQLLVHTTFDLALGWLSLHFDVKCLQLSLSLALMLIIFLLSHCIFACCSVSLTAWSQFDHSPALHGLLSTYDMMHCNFLSHVLIWFFPLLSHTFLCLPVALIAGSATVSESLLYLLSSSWSCIYPFSVLTLYLLLACYCDHLITCYW